MGESALSGTKTISLYSKHSGIKIYTDDEWRSDAWDGITYGREYDFSRSFFEQFHALSLEVPHMARSCGTGNVNCDYIANMDNSRNCYLMFNSNHGENLAYGSATEYCKDSFEITHVDSLEKCYEMLFSEKCFRTHFGEGCFECSEVWFSKNCSGCLNSFGCVNLKNKSYCFLNEQLTKEEYEKRIQELRLDTWSGLQKAKELAHAFWLKYPVKNMSGFSNLNAEGEYIGNSKNIYDGYIVFGGENLAYSQYQLTGGAKDSMDITVWGSANELCYENVICGYGAANVHFSAECWPEVQNVEYSMFMKSSSDCFGCFGLKNKQYCIFNTQYTKEEYFGLRERIIDQMRKVPYTDNQGRTYLYGEFFPPELSPFGYNTSTLNEQFPLTKEEAIGAGHPWDDPEHREHTATIQASKLPDSIAEVSDTILSEVIACATCKKAYRIIKPELEFLRGQGIPLPRSCIECRHKERISRRRKPEKYSRACMCDGGSASLHAQEHGHTGKCPNTFTTSYAPEKPEIVYCENCYTREVA